MIRSLFDKSIWHRGAIPALELKYAGPLKRVFLPLYNLIAILGGWYAVHSGIPSLDKLLPEPVSNTFGYLFAGAAVAAMIGLAFPALWRLEIAAKWVMFGILGTYLIALRILATSDDGARDFVSCVAGMAAVIILFRLWILGKEIAERRDESESEQKFFNA